MDVETVLQEGYARLLNAAAMNVSEQARSAFMEHFRPMCERDDMPRRWPRVSEELYGRASSIGTAAAGLARAMAQRSIEPAELLLAIQCVQETSRRVESLAGLGDVLAPTVLCPPLSAAHRQVIADKLCLEVTGSGARPHLRAAS